MKWNKYRESFIISMKSNKYRIRYSEVLVISMKWNKCRSEALIISMKWNKCRIRYRAKLLSRAWNEAFIKSVFATGKRLSSTWSEINIEFVTVKSFGVYMWDSTNFKKLVICILLLKIIVSNCKLYYKNRVGKVIVFIWKEVLWSSPCLMVAHRLSERKAWMCFG